jgi:hypothetical protein
MTMRVVAGSAHICKRIQKVVRDVAQWRMDLKDRRVSPLGRFSLESNRSETKGDLTICGLEDVFMHASYSAYSRIGSIVIEWVEHYLQGVITGS